MIVEKNIVGTQNSLIILITIQNSPNCPVSLCDAQRHLSLLILRTVNCYAHCKYQLTLVELRRNPLTQFTHERGNN